MEDVRKPFLVGDGRYERGDVWSEEILDCIEILMMLKLKTKRSAKKR